MPLAASSRAGAGVGPELTSLLVLDLLRVEQRDHAAARAVLAGEHHGAGHLLHGQVPDVVAERAPAGGAAGELGPTVGADQVAGVTLDIEMSRSKV